jgi:hypothetical protein
MSALDLEAFKEKRLTWSWRPKHKNRGEARKMIICVSLSRRRSSIAIIRWVQGTRAWLEEEDAWENTAV